MIVKIDNPNAILKGLDSFCILQFALNELDNIWHFATVVNVVALSENNRLRPKIRNCSFLLMEYTRCFYSQTVIWIEGRSEMRNPQSLLFVSRYSAPSCSDIRHPKLNVFPILHQ
jgi:hypothetical protein